MQLVLAVLVLCLSCSSVSSLSSSPVLAAAAVPAVDAWANFTLFADSACKSPLGDPAELPFGSSPKCQTPPEADESFILQCSTPASSNLTSFFLAIWNATTDCSGEATISIDAVNATSGACAPANITYSGTLLQAYIQVACSAAAAEHSSSPLAPLILSPAVSRAALAGSSVSALLDETAQIVQEEVARQRRLQRDGGGRGAARAAVNPVRRMLEGAGEM